MCEKKQNREIDIVGLLKKILSEKRLLGIFVSAFAVIGIVVALSTPKKYTSMVVLAPELSNGGAFSGSLSSIASMVGVNIGASKNDADAIYPEIYPDVLTSSDFIIKLFDVKVQLEDGNVSKSYYNHLIEDAKIPFWNYPKIWLARLFASDDKAQGGGKGINPFNLTKQQDQVLNAIRSNISCIVDKNTSVITISVTDLDRNVSAIMADTIQKQLQEYITVYRTQKARNDMEYTEGLYEKAKVEYNHAQQVYSSYADANEDLWLESFKSKRDELENEMQLRYNIYNQIAQQLQYARAKVQEQTPVFSVIQSASVPLKASSLPRSLIVLLYVFLGFVADALWILYLRDYIRKRRIMKEQNK